LHRAPPGRDRLRWKGRSWHGQCKPRPKRVQAQMEFANSDDWKATQIPMSEAKSSKPRSCERMKNIKNGQYFL
jgi:hypothetical protein